MSTTPTADEVYVSCADFCGARITNTGPSGALQHIEGCGATPDDLRKLDEELAAKRIHAVRDAATAGEEAAEELDAAIAPDDAPPEAKFRCSCGAAFDTWPELGQHQEGNAHTGMWEEPADALDDDALLEREETTSTVDGVKAKIEHNSTQQTLINAPATDDSVLGNLARAMEEEARLRTEANKAKNALAHAAKRTEAAKAFAAQHYSQSRQLAMTLTTGGTDPDDDDGDDA